MVPPPGIAVANDASAVTIGIDSPTATLLHAAITTTAAAAAAVASKASSAPPPTMPPTTAADGPHQSSGGEGECELLGSFALLIQGALGALALLSLVFKRWRERPQRPLKIWFFDASKQVFGSVLVHVANVFMSMLTSGSFSIKLEPGTADRMMARAASSGDNYEPNPCSFYLLNLAIDTTLGIPILIILLRITTGLVSFTPLGKPLDSIQSGNYGDPPNVWWWLKQSVIYFCCLFGMKICVLIIFLMMPWISIVGDWALSWTAGNERLQIAFVMMIFPLIMNCLQYYIIDSFIKKKETEHEILPSEDPDQQQPGRYDDTVSAEDAVADSDSDIEQEPDKPDKGHSSGVDSEYDPDVDGVAPTVIGSSSSRPAPRGKVIGPDLFPKE